MHTENNLNNTSAVFETNWLNSLMHKARNAGKVSYETLKEGWSVLDGNAERLVTKFPSLQIRNGYRLWSYQYFDRNGNSFPFALPAEMTPPDPEEFNDNDSRWHPWKAIPGALKSESVILGNGSLQSYLEYSICMRELYSIGSFWHGIGWHAVGFVYDSMDRHGNRFLFSRAMNIEKNENLLSWNWNRKVPVDLRTRVDRDDHNVYVRFFTAAASGMRCLIFNTDTYTAGEYDFSSERVSIAENGSGFLF